MAKPSRSRSPSGVEDAARCVSDIVGAAEARRSALAPPRSDAIGRSARALARSINASLRCISGVLSCLFALRRRSCNLIVRGRWTLPERTCNGRVDSVSRSDLLLKKETLARVGGRADKTHVLRTLAAAAELWHAANDIPSSARHDGGCPRARDERRGELFAKLDPGRKTERGAARGRPAPRKSSRAHGAARARRHGDETAGAARRERVDRFARASIQ